jgi:predicted glycosyltransferase
VRTEKQEEYLKKKLVGFTRNNNVIITRYLPNLVNLCFYSALIISGGGTIVRESSLLNVPSIEYFPGDTAPQELFLMDNDFPLEHIKDIDKIIERSIEILEEFPLSNRFNLSFKEKLRKFENPNRFCFDHVSEKLQLKNH